MMSSSPWSSGADSSSIWNSNSPNLNLLRRYSLRSAATSSNTTNSIVTSTPVVNNVNSLLNNNNLMPTTSTSTLTGNTTTTSNKSTCSWQPSADNKYLIGYLIISRQDLDVYNSNQLGFHLVGGKTTHDNQLGAIVEHVVPGSLMNIICKLRVGDEIVEWNGFNLRNKRNEEVMNIVESVKNTNSLRLVAVRLQQQSQQQQQQQQQQSQSQQAQLQQSHQQDLTSASIEDSSVKDEVDSVVNL